MSYLGDLSAAESWDLLKSDEKAILVDVRTTAEWTFVGFADLSSLGKRPIFCEWQSYPSMAMNTKFVEDVTGQIDDDQTVLCLCRSGARSAAAASALTQAGFQNTYNISDGFEGNPNANGQRGTLNGWKAANLPWRQG